VRTMNDRWSASAKAAEALFVRRSRTSAVVLLGALSACGSSSGAELDPDTVSPLSWSAGDRVATVVVEHLWEDLRTLENDVCSLKVQLAEATVSGEVPRTDVVDQCIVTESGLELRDQVGFEPLCGGAVRVRMGSLDQSLEICSEVIPDEIDVDCEDIRNALELRFTSTAGDAVGADDSLGDADVTVEGATRPTLMSPVGAGDGTSLWPEGELLVGWGGFGAESVQITLRNRSGEGPAVVCFTDDDGRFTVPEELVAPYRSQISALEVARIQQEVVDVDGVEVRVTSRVADAVWLNPRMM